VEFWSFYIHRSAFFATGRQQTGGEQLVSQECDLLAEYNSTPPIMVLYDFLASNEILIHRSH